MFIEPSALLVFAHTKPFRSGTGKTNPRKTSFKPWPMITSVSMVEMFDLYLPLISYNSSYHNATFDDGFYWNENTFDLETKFLSGNKLITNWLMLL